MGSDGHVWVLASVEEQLEGLVIGACGVADLRGKIHVLFTMLLLERLVGGVGGKCELEGAVVGKGVVGLGLGAEGLHEWHNHMVELVVAVVKALEQHVAAAVAFMDWHAFHVIQDGQKLGSSFRSTCVLFALLQEGAAVLSESSMLSECAM